MSVWKSDEELLIFASLIAPPKIMLFENKYQAFNTAFILSIRHLKVCVQCVSFFFNSPVSV